MKKVLSKISIASIGLLTPMFAFAATSSGIILLLDQVQNIIAAVIPVLIGLALLAFMWGILQYLFTQNKDQGKFIMIWGIVALFVMTSVWGLVSIVRSTILPNSNTNQLNAVDIPKAPRFTN
jgi:uncharacterized membrane-anchored protein